ncbi:MAG TPA: sugar transferase, partial [Phototrophicaceae bacterium]|nr:sugar transferase [Phototrophicaceae bacterium]
LLTLVFFVGILTGVFQNTSLFVGIILLLGLILIWYMGIRELNRTSKKFGIPDGIMMLLPWVEGEARLNDELDRGRRFENAVSVIYCALRSSDNQPVSENETRKLVRAIAAITYKSDLVTWYEDGIIVGLPEAEPGKARQEVDVFVGQLARILLELIKIESKLLVGVNIFTDEGQTADKLAEIARSNLREVMRKDLDNYPKASGHTYDFRHGDLVVDLETRLSIEYDAEWVSQMPSHTPASRNVYRLIKRVIDMILSGLFLIPAMPVMLLFAALIYLDDRQVIFEKQQRTGYNGSRFGMYRFRTMRVDAKIEPPRTIILPDGTVRYVWAAQIKNDPRLTRVGRILRKTKLDNVPQLLNVLKGDMSLVGPRPTSWDLDKYTPMQTARLTVPPGVTGLWQVSALGATNFDERLVWDLKYIEKASLRLDFLIMWRTCVCFFEWTFAI